MPTRRYRYTWDEIGSLDCDYMAGWGAFEPNQRQTIDFDDDDLPVLAFRMDSAGDSFSVAYQLNRRDDKHDGEFVQTTIYLQRRPCRFGGTRVHFICPCCGRTKRRLAVLPEGLRCGRCGRVTWDSRREQPLHRLIRKANSRAIALGCNSWEEVPQRRPAHMRVERFERLRREHAKLVTDINRQIAIRLSKKPDLFHQMAMLVRLGI
jgi:hypothetical protein